MKSTKSKIIFAILLFFILVLLKYNTLDEPYHWDALEAIINPSLDMYDNNFRLIHSSGEWAPHNFKYLGANYGHPPFQRITLAVVWKIFGTSLQVSHLYILLIAFIGLIFTYKLAEYLFNSLVGFGAVILLLFNQLFFAQTGILNDSIPLLTLGVISVYYYLRKKYFLFVLFSALMILIKETVALILLSIFIYFFVDKLIKNRKISLLDMKKSLIICLPLVPLFIWFFYTELMLGRSLNTYLFYNKSKFFSLFFLNIFRHLFYDFTLDNVNKYNFIISLAIFANLLRFKKFKNKSIYILFSLIIALHLILFSYADDLPRYFTPILPFFYILGANSLYNLFSKSRYKVYIYFAVIFLCVILFVSNYTGNRTVSGWKLESNLEYLDMLETHKESSTYLESTFSNHTIFTCWPLARALSDTRYGYVSKKMNISDNASLIDNGDLIYFTRQSPCKEIKKFLKNNKNKTILIKRFEQNNKSTEIYRYNLDSK